MDSSSPSPSPLADRRKELGMSQRELGEILGRGDQTISNWESGIYVARLTVLEFKQLCRTLQWSEIEELPDRLGPEG